MTFQQILELLALLENEYRISDIDFIKDSGEGDDNNKISLTVSQLGTIYFYPTCLYIFQLTRQPKKVVYVTDTNQLFTEIKEYFDCE